MVSINIMNENDGLAQRVEELERIVKAQTFVIECVKDWVVNHIGESKNPEIAMHVENFSVKRVLDHPEEFSKEALKKLRLLKMPN